MEHGINVTKKKKSVSSPIVADSAVHFIVGCAPVQMVDGKANELVFANTYAEAVAKLGYSSDWEKYDICAEIYTAFQLYGVSPVVIVNVLDPTKHLTEEKKETIALVDGKCSMSLETVATSVLISLGGVELEKGKDYELIYTDEMLNVARIEGGKIESDTTELTIKSKQVDVTKVTKADIIGGYDTETARKTGFELVDSVYPKFRAVPTLLLAPNFSKDPEVAAIMAAKAENINGIFKAKAIIDIDTAEAMTYQKATEFKNKKSINSASQLVVWPMFTLNGVKYPHSVHLASLISKTDADKDYGDGSPCESASNKSLQVDGMCLANGTEVLLDLPEANALNKAGIITGLNIIGGFKSWGNYTACYPASGDLTDYFYNVGRMFEWVANTVTLSTWESVDRNVSIRLIESVVQKMNVWLNGLFSDGKILGGRIAFLDEENTMEGIAEGRMYYHIYLTPPSPGQEFDYILEYDQSNLSYLF